MFSKRFTSALVILLAVFSFGFHAPSAAAQVASRVAHGQQSSVSQRSWPAKAKTPRLMRGPVTPAESALKASQKKSHQVHPLGNGSSSSVNSIFLSALEYNTAGLSTHSVAAGDLNGDGKIDLVLADQCATNNCSNASVSVLMGNGDGSFQTVVSYDAGGQSALSIVLGDVNGDGKLDAIVANNCVSNSDCSNGSVSVLLGNGDGTFQTAVSYNSGGQGAQHAAIADVNGDGKPDLLVANNCATNSNCSNGSMSVLLNNGDGTFQAAVAYNSGGQGATFLAVGDVSGDGRPDVVEVNNCVSNSDCSNGSVSVLLGNGDGTFQSAVSYAPGGQSPSSVVLGDVNGDGKLDVVASSYCASNSNCSNGIVSVLLGNGDGTFQPAVSYNSGGQSASSVAVADINGDGKIDIFVANQSDSDGNWQDGSVVGVLLGNGDGTFQPSVTYVSGEFSAASVIAADVDGDGRPDVVLANGCVDNYSCATGAASILLGNGDGTLRGAVNYGSGAWSSYSVAMADVDGDGKLDLLVASQCNNNNSCSNGAASVLLGNGDGTFRPAASYNSGGLNAFTVVSVDVNGDGKLDLLVVNECADNSCSSGSASVLLGNGDGTFQSPLSYGSGGTYSYSLAVADVNGDGKPDLIVANECADNNCSSNGSVSVLLGNGDGTFQTAVPYGSGGLYPLSVAVGDVNGDGKPDLIVANECADNNCSSNGSVSVLLGNGDGTLQTAVPYGSGGLYALGVAVGDLNGDGKPDLIVANQCGNNNNCSNGSMGVLLGNGDGTFQTATATVTPVLGGIQTIVLGDFNGDHNLDVAAGSGNTLLLGNGDGTFQSPIALGAGGPGIATGDLNGDGRPDLAVGGVSVLLNVSSGFVLPTSTTVATSANPTAFAESITFTATVGAQFGGSPTGTVTFSDGSTMLGQVTLSAGTASYSTAALSIGTHSITAAYSGDAHFGGSTSSVVSQVVQQADTGTALTAAPNPANVNQSITFTASVTSGSSGAPTGTVSFMDGATQIGSSSLNGNGIATLSISTLTVGTHSLTAVYGGDSNFNGSTSSAASVVVTASGFSLSSSVLSPASVAPGSSAHSTITITPAGGFDPSTVSLSCSVSPVVSPAVTCSLGTISVSGGNGSSTLTIGTTGPHAALVPPAQRASGKLAVLALLIPGLFLCGAGLDKSNRRKLLAIGFVFLVLTGCMLQTACVGASTSGSTSPGTPAGTYTVTVTGSSGGMQQATTASLNVQ
jgi:hypothetical protein